MSDKKPSSREENEAISEEDERRFKALFDKVDANKDGSIDIKELTSALHRVSVGDSAGQAKVMLDSVDKDKDAVINFGEFVHYMQQHEGRLRVAFSSLDRDQNGKLVPSEVQAAFAKLNVHISLDEASQLTRKMDKNNDLEIEWNEWRDFFGIYPTDSLQDMIEIWRSRPMIDIGEQLTIPPEFRSKGIPWRHLVAGGVAGAVSRTATAPLDRLKIIFQVYGSKREMSILGSFKHMIREGGVRSLWRGNGTSVIKIAPESALKFGAYDELKKLLKGESARNVTIAERFAAGSMAGALAQTAIFPMEVIKTRLAVSKTGQYKGLIDCTVKIFRREGIRAFYRGYVPNVIGIIPYAGIDLTIYETLKLMYLRRNPHKKNPGVVVLLACGSVSSTCGQLASYPLALVKTKLQAQATGDIKEGFVTLMRNIVRREGLRGLYRGIVPNFMKVLPAVSISYVVYEHTKKALGL